MCKVPTKRLKFIRNFRYRNVAMILHGMRYLVCRQLDDFLELNLYQKIQNFFLLQITKIFVNRCRDENFLNLRVKFRKLCISIWRLNVFALIVQIILIVNCQSICFIRLFLNFPQKPFRYKSSWKTADYFVAYYAYTQFAFCDFKANGWSTYLLNWTCVCFSIVLW